MTKTIEIQQADGSFIKELTASFAFLPCTFRFLSDYTAKQCAGTSAKKTKTEDYSGKLTSTN